MHTCVPPPPRSYARGGAAAMKRMALACVLHAVPALHASGTGWMAAVCECVRVAYTNSVHIQHQSQLLHPRLPIAGTACEVLTAASPSNMGSSSPPKPPPLRSSSVAVSGRSTAGGRGS